MLATRRAALTSTLATGALALLARPAGAQATGGVLSGTAAAVDLLAQQVMAQGRQPGMSVCVVEAGRVVLAKGYGVMELGKPRTVDEATLFGVASNTKAMTAACIAMLVDEGKVEWDAPVTRYLPQFAMSDETVTRLMTVRDLLVHRSGLSLG
ncbi:MAG TPA: serine hydrolase domain-containing protein, partial [Caulobacteraceae bacterium]